MPHQGVQEPLLHGDNGSSAVVVLPVSEGGFTSSGRCVHAPRKKTSRGRVAAWYAVLGAILTLGAYALHHSGLEPVDMSTADDACFGASSIVLSGLPLDACMVRESEELGSDCGEAPANAFCVMKGGNYHVNFTLTDITTKRGGISYGNRFIGGKLGFSEICCDMDHYNPHASRWLLLAGGAVLSYSLAYVAARILLSLLEAGAAFLDLDAGEALYFLLGAEQPLKWLLFASWLVSWTHWVLWKVWCSKGIDCESHGSNTRSLLYSLSQVVLLFASASFFAKAAPRIISVRYLYAGSFAKVRDTMRKESLLAALTHPEVRAVVQQRREQQDAARAAAEHAHNDADTSAAATGLPPSLSFVRRRPSVAKKGKGAKVKPAANLPDLTSLLETSGYGSYWGSGGAVERFKNFLAHYSRANEEDVAAEAAAEGEILFSNLVGAWDVNDDGAVGLHDFEELFRRVKPPPGFASHLEAAAEAWAMFDLDKDGTLGKEEVINALALIYKDRSNTALTVLSNESAVGSLEAAIGFVLYTLLAFLAASMLGVASTSSSSTSSLDFFTTYVLALSFIFGDTVRSVFRSVLYLFGEQPFAVGDWLDIDGEVWCVESFDLIYTQLRKWEENQYAKVPNDMLIDSKLINLSKGGAFKEQLSVNVPLSLPMTAIRDLKEKLLEAGAEHAKDIIADSPHVKVDSIESGQVMSLLVEWVYAFPPGDRPRMDSTREYMVAACKEALMDIGVVEHQLNIGLNMRSKAKK